MTVKPHHKKKRIKLSKDAYVKLKTEMWNKQYQRCGRCNLYTPPETTHFHHIKSRGAGGDDSEENGKIVCWACHNLIEAGNL